MNLGHASLLEALHPGLRRVPLPPRAQSVGQVRAGRALGSAGQAVGPAGQAGQGSGYWGRSSVSASARVSSPASAQMQGRIAQAAEVAAERIFEETPAFEEAPPSLRRKLRDRIVELALLAAELRDEEARQDARLRAQRPNAVPAARADGRSRASGQGLARAQSAGDQFSGVAAERGAAQLQALREAIDFPTYVQSLIYGVFTAITRSSVAQLESLGALLDGVSASSAAFAEQNVADGAAARWVVQRFPSLFALVSSGEEGPRLQLVGEVDLSEHAEQLREGLEATEDELSQIDEDELGETLIPLVRRKMGRDKQAMLATMVMLGLQRVVVDEGRLHASMDMRIDTRSVAEQREQERFDSRVSTSASASVGAGPWAASGSASATVGYVRSDDQYSQEELASQAALRSSVDLVFRTEQIPLDRMADSEARQAIMSNTRVPPASWTQGSLLPTGDRQHATGVDLGEVPDAPAARDPVADRQRILQQGRDGNASGGGGGGGGTRTSGGGGGGGGAAPRGGGGRTPSDGGGGDAAPDGGGAAPDGGGGGGGGAAPSGPRRP